MGADAASLTEADGADDDSRSADDLEVTLGEISSELMIEHRGDEFAVEDHDDEDDMCSGEEGEDEDE